MRRPGRATRPLSGSRDRGDVKVETSRYGMNSLVIHFLFPVGHRRWIFNPEFFKTGFGVVELPGRLVARVSSDVLAPHSRMETVLNRTADAPASQFAPAVTVQWVIGPFGPRQETPNGVSCPPRGIRALSDRARSLVLLAA